VIVPQLGENGRNPRTDVLFGQNTGSPQWGRLLKVIGRTDVGDDPRFATPELRYEHRAEVDAMISIWIQQRTKFEAMEEFGRADVPAGAVLTTAELLADPYLQKRGTFVTMEHPVRGPILIPGFPLKMSASSVPILPAPLLGQHNEEVYEGMLGISADEVARLRQVGAI
jgi:formyl-CoA transferase